MKLIVGLGNPGEKYTYTRHNVGFLAVDFLLQDPRFMNAMRSQEFKSEMATVQSAEEKIIFLKPQTYMNDSGQALRVICNFYKMDFSHDLLVIQDEVDLPFGTVRLAANSSSAGHNGIQSIIDNLGTQDFQRVRVGVETRASRNDIPTDAFVLQNFSEQELQQLQQTVLPEIKKQVEAFLGL